MIATTKFAAGGFAHPECEMDALIFLLSLFFHNAAAAAAAAAGYSRKEMSGSRNCSWFREEFKDGNDG